MDGSLIVPDPDELDPELDTINVRDWLKLYPELDTLNWPSDSSLDAEDAGSDSGGDAPSPANDGACVNADVQSPTPACIIPSDTRARWLTTW